MVNSVEVVNPMESLNYLLSSLAALLVPAHPRPRLLPFQKDTSPRSQTTESAHKRDGRTEGEWKYLLTGRAAETICDGIKMGKDIKKVSYTVKVA